MTQANQYVTLGVGRDVFAVPVECVREVLDVPAIAHLPDAPAFLLGMIDVRGQAVPVIDLRCRLGFPALGASPDTRILVLEITVAERVLVVGLMADRVFEVTGLDGGALEAPPEIGTRWRSECIAGVGRRGRDFVVVFDPPRLVGSEDCVALGAAA